MKTRIYKVGIAIALVLSAFSQFSCSKWDDFKKYTRDGEIMYAGKLDSVKVFSGNGKVMLRGQFNADPKIKLTKIYWNDFRDSVQFNIDKGPERSVFERTFNVDEGVKNFVVYNFDGSGNRSVAVNAVGTSYGSAYRRKLNNRFISTVEFAPEGATINWDPMDLSIGPQFTEVEYVLNGETKRAVVPVNQSKILLEGVTSATTIRYRTIFKPEPTSIDTFAVAFREREIKPVPKLKNSKVPFIASTRQGRWGTLADWTTNSAAKIHAGGHGGWDEWNNNIFNLESGWGAPAITNGKVYQTLELEPGSYTFEISDLMNTNLTLDDKAFLVVAIGNTIPDVEQISTALGSVQIVEGKPLLELQVTFTVRETSNVSMGFLTTQSGGTPGRFANIRAFDFYKN